MTGSADADRDGFKAEAKLDEAALLSRAAALDIPLPADRQRAVLEGSRRLETAARLLRDALARVTASGEP